MYKEDLFKNNLVRMSRPMGIDRMDADIMNAMTRASSMAKNQKDRVWRRSLLLKCYDLVQVHDPKKMPLRWAK